MHLINAICLASIFSTVPTQCFMMNTPVDVMEGEPTLLTWDPAGSTPPYILDVFPGGVSNAASIEVLGTALTGSSLTWLVNLPAGTSIGLTIIDATGLTSQSAPFTIQAGPGPASSCLTQPAECT